MSTESSTSETPAALSPDELVSQRYRVRRRIGAGAEAEVYLAVDEALGRPVALKLPRAAAGSEEAAARFVLEARLTARFSHPHLVTVHDAGLHRGRPFLVLEYLDGENLRQRLEQGPLPPREALRLGRAVAEALAEAHRAGVVHADLKPENLVIPADGRLRVVDLGLSGLGAAPGGGTSGSGPYLAPERWEGEPPSPAADVWALGMLLGEALAGRRPLDRLGLINRESPRLGAAAEASGCAPLVRRCLALAAGQRPSAEEVARELEVLLRGGAAEGARSPFRGLEAFTEADAQDFFGREDDVEAVVERLRTRGLVPVVGPSGVGKSSFLQAGLVPRLRDQGPLLAITCRPGRRPLASVLAALLAQGLSGTAGELLAEARARPGFLLGALRSVARARGARVVLVLDQFEEAQTLGEPAETAALLQGLAGTLLPDDACRVLLGLRSDFLGAFAETALQPALGAVVVLRPLSEQALAQAFAGPLRRVGYRVDEPELPGQVARELLGQPAALPLLQFAADALWRRRDTGQRLLLASEYRALGGATGALAHHAERLTAELTEAERAQARALLLHLVTAEGTRRPRTRAELLAHAGAEAAPVLERLVSNRLLVSGDAGDGEPPLVELAHESLASTWPALARWLAETVEARRLEQELEQAAALWASRGRAAAETWSGTALRDAAAHVEAWGLRLAPRQREFLEAGTAEEARRLRRRRLALGGAFAGLTALLVATGAAALQFREDERRALAQQAEIRTAAADMGRFELVLAPFDWDAEKFEARPASAADLPRLGVTFHEVPKDREDEPGPPVEPQYVRRGDARVAADGGRVEVLELRSRPTWVEVTGRGAGGSTCPPSWILLRSTPGYSERSQQPRVTLRVPTCQATLAGTLEVPAGPFLHKDPATGAVREVEVAEFRMDRHEVTQEAYRVYAAMSRLTGEEPLYAPAIAGGDLPRRRMTQLDLRMARRFCRYMGKDLPTLDEWRKAARGGVWLDAARTIRNPLPLRVSPWGDADPRHADLKLTPDTGAISPIREVGAFPDDRSPYGILDLMGGGSEWTRDLDPDPPHLPIVMGGNNHENELTRSPFWLIDQYNTRIPGNRSYGVNARCVLEAPPPGAAAPPPG